MSYALTETADTVEISIDASSREDLFKETIIATLAAAYGHEPSSSPTEGQALPIQAVGTSDAETLKELVGETLLAVHDAPGTLRPPRWLAFDSGRVTANLPVDSTSPHKHAFDLAGDVELVGLKARAVLKHAHH